MSLINKEVNDFKVQAYVGKDFKGVWLRYWSGLSVFTANTGRKVFERFFDRRK